MTANAVLVGHSYGGAAVGDAAGERQRDGYATVEWARQWPAEEIWNVRKPGA